VRPSVSSSVTGASPGKASIVCAYKEPSG
jgi:hypothetical protein